MCSFFDLKGNECSKSDFIQIYSNVYFYLNDYNIEREIERIIKKDEPISSDELVMFLRWKVGDKGRSNAIITQYGCEIKLDPIIELADAINASWKDKTDEELFDMICNHNIENVGSVYTLALIYLITKGREPIYDKFAKIALDVIIDNTHPFRKPKKYIELPDKSEQPKVIARYEEYKKCLSLVFGDLWEKDRNIDRALWTYGHLFR